MLRAALKILRRSDAFNVIIRNPDPMFFIQILHTAQYIPNLLDNTNIPTAAGVRTRDVAAIDQMVFANR